MRNQHLDNSDFKKLMKAIESSPVLQTISIDIRYCNIQEPNIEDINIIFENKKESRNLYI